MGVRGRVRPGGTGPEGGEGLECQLSHQGCIAEGQWEPLQDSSSGVVWSDSGLRKRSVWSQGWQAERKVWVRGQAREGKGLEKC